MPDPRVLQAVIFILAIGFGLAVVLALAARQSARRSRRLAECWRYRCDHRDRIIYSAFCRKCGPPIDAATVGRIAEALCSPSETMSRHVR